MKILVAEDDRLSRTFLTEFLQDYGEVTATEDGMQAIDAYLDSLKSQKPYDLFCLDIMMPKVDGLKVLKVIRGLETQYRVPAEEHLPIVMMTALADKDYIDQAFELGCDAYASKPLEMDKIKELMATLGLV